MNQKLEAIANKASADLLQLIKEGEDKILEAWNACEQEAQDNETKPKFKLGLGITLDLDNDSMETALTFGIKHKLSVNTVIPDPNQTSLPFAKEVITTEGKTTKQVADELINKVGAHFKSKRN